MRNAKIALASVILLGIAGGALAYKSNRILNIFYIDTTTMLAGQKFTYCTAPTSYYYTPRAFGTRTIKASTGATDTTCPVISVEDFS